MLTFKKVIFALISPLPSYRKCIKFTPKKGGSSDPSDPPFPTPLGLGAGGQLVGKSARMCMSKSESNGYLFRPEMRKLREPLNKAQ